MIKTTTYVLSAFLMALLGIGIMYFCATKIAQYTAHKMKMWNEAKVRECVARGGDAFYFPSQDGNYLRCVFHDGVLDEQVTTLEGRA